MKREKIEQIKKFIKNESIYFIEVNGGLTRAFFDNHNLKESVSNKFYIVESLYTISWGTTSEIDFDDFFNIALKEFKSNHPITVQESVSLKKVKETWLKSERRNEIGWENGSFDTYRDRYFEYLKRTGRSEKYILENKKSSLSIIEKLADPNSDSEILVKGLVVGSVQSGKTANFNGVINSAIDLGYRLIIVLSGITEDLRSQTQDRIDNDIIGDKKSNVGPNGEEIWRGVGSVSSFKIENGRIVVRSITSYFSDFKRGLWEGDHSLNSFNILVCKKNVSILKNVLLWLNEKSGGKKLDIPFLVIDDEADNASLNNMGFKGKEYATKINMEIRALLDLFTIRSYLGYTATPFANILQDRNERPDKTFSIPKANQAKLPKGEPKNHDFTMISNLFPEDFIDLLYPPSNYIGIKHFFDTKEEDLNKKIDKIESLIADPINDYLGSFPPRVFKSDGTPTFLNEKNEDKELEKLNPSRSAKQTDEYPKVLPESLKESILCFILSIAVRLSRRPEMVKSDLYQPHNSMLIHISRFGLWQNRTKKLIKEFLEGPEGDSGKGIFSHINNDSIDSETFKEFERIWNRYYYYIINNIKDLVPAGYEDDFMVPKDFKKDIRSLLPQAIKNIEVKAINSLTKDKLFYPKKDDKDFTEKKYIAIGGNRLSRGFTLEGLTINYFLRGTENADTLMQMGRWFGYRPGYLDCCKLFTNIEAIEKFNESSLIIEDLENKFEQLSKLPDKSPRDFTLWILNNPGVLKLTRGNFLKNLNWLSLVFSDTVQQSTQFILKKSLIEESFHSFKIHINELTWAIKDGYIIHNTDHEGLLKFIDLPNTMNNLNVLGLRGYLKNCTEKGKLQNWTIAIKKISQGDGYELDKDLSGLPWDIKLITRRGPKSDEINDRAVLLNKNIFKARNSTIISPIDFSITLNQTQIDEAERQFRQLKKEEYINNKKLSDEDAEKKAATVAMSDKAYRIAMDDTTGILVIYLLDLQKVFEVTAGQIDQQLTEYKINNDLDNLNIPLIGYALGFPAVPDVDGDIYAAKHDYDKPLISMNIQELKIYIENNDLDLDITQNWSTQQLLTAIEELIDEREGAEEFDDNLTE
jgi:hypothetical protein